MVCADNIDRETFLQKWLYRDPVRKYTSPPQRIPCEAKPGHISLCKLKQRVCVILQAVYPEGLLAAALNFEYQARFGSPFPSCKVSHDQSSCTPVE